ncbi:MAG: NAD(P)-binding domain-containing protein [Thiolinea sp.]
MQRLNIIGAGQVGQTLGYLWQQTGVLQLGEVLNASLESAQSAVRFMGAGQAVVHIDCMQPANIYLLGCPDNHIQACCDTLAASGLLQAGQVYFIAAVPCPRPCWRAPVARRPPLPACIQLSFADPTPCRPELQADLLWHGR